MASVDRVFPAHARSLRARKAVRALSALALFAALAACQDGEGLRSARAYKPISAETLALMQEKGMTKHSPILIRAFKKEAELEIWKMRADGQYALLKTYPMCRWSGQLGPKTREGDRQVPEGFYSITPTQMNPNSNYYLSFNVGYPNAYDRAHNRTGSMIMVHGDCSSAGCFSMTDTQIADIYALAREAFGGGQRAIQMQSLPFRMSPENLAKHRLDPNMPFWREIKEGVDQFEVTKQEPQVAVCGKRYVFNATPRNAASLDPRAACPPLQQDPQVKELVAQRNHSEAAQVAALIAKGVKPVKVVYQDGGQHPSFANIQRVSRPEALAQAPREIELEDRAKAASAKPVRVAGKTDPKAEPGLASKPDQKPATPVATTVARQTPATPAPSPAAAPTGEPATAFAAPQPAPAAERPFYSRILGVDAAPAAAPAPSLEQALPPATTPVRAAPKAGEKPKKDKQARLDRLPDLIRGAQPALPSGFTAYAPLSAR